MTNWGGAYHWATDSPISALKAIQHRESGRLEAGDCWCCKNCYTANPRKGIQIFPRKHNTTPHFWVGSRASYTLNQCDGYRTQMTIGESYRYTQFYRDLKNWLVDEQAKLALCFSDFEEDKSRKYSDFLLNLTKPIKGYTNLSILIIHKNRMRQPQHSLAIVIDLSHWTLEQLNDFEFGKRKIIEEFGQLLTPAEIVPESSEVVVYGEEWENSLIRIFGKNMEERTRDAIEEINDAISEIEKFREISRNLRVAEDLLSTNETFWRGLDFEELSNYFVNDIRKFFPSVCSGFDDSFESVVTYCNNNSFHPIIRITIRGVILNEYEVQFRMNQVKEKYGVIIGVVKSYSKSFRDKRIRGTWFQLESKEDLNLPCLSSFIDHAKAQWDIVKSNSDYYYHRPKFTDLEEYKQLTDEAVDLGKRTYLSPHEQFRLYNLNKRKDQLFAPRWNRKNQITVINRFVYYLFFGNHRKANRWD